MKTTWDFSPLFKKPSEAALKKELERVKKESYKFINKWKDRADYLEDPKTLRQALDEYEHWRRHTGTSGAAQYYVDLRLAVETDNKELKAWNTQVTNAATKIGNDIQFFTMRLAKVSAAKQKEFLAHRDLAKYRHYLDRLFANAKYLLTEAEEKIISLKESTGYSNWVQMVESLLAKEEREVLVAEGKVEKRPLAGMSPLTQHPDRRIRQNAAAAINDIYRQHLEVAENEINSIFLNKKIDDELRGVKRPDELQHVGDDMETKVVDTIVKTIAAHNDIPKRFYALKAKLLGIRDPKYYDRSAAYGSIEKHYSYEEAVALIQRVFTKLDKDFARIFKSFTNDGLTDVYPRAGKRGGAFCAHRLLSQPTYIMLNHTGTLRDVTTIAHEAGHGINNELIRAKQHALYFDTPTSTAEVASTFMEDFVLEEMAKGMSEEERLSFLVAKLDDVISTTFRQIAFYRFEQELHQRFRETGYVAKEEINKLFKKHMASYLGKMADECDLGWVAWIHLRYFFYVYTYASGLLISKALQAGVKKDPKFIKKVKEFLAAGTSDSPKNIFAKLGIDITDKKFWEQGIKEIENLLNETEKLAKKLSKI